MCVTISIHLTLLSRVANLTGCLFIPDAGVCISHAPDAPQQMAPPYVAHPPRVQRHSDTDPSMATSVRTARWPTADGFGARRNGGQHGIAVELAGGPRAPRGGIRVAAASPSSQRRSSMRWRLRWSLRGENGGLGTRQRARGDKARPRFGYLYLSSILDIWLS